MCVFSRVRGCRQRSTLLVRNKIEKQMRELELTSTDYEVIQDSIRYHTKTYQAEHGSAASSCSLNC